MRWPHAMPLQKVLEIPQRFAPHRPGDECPAAAVQPHHHMAAEQEIHGSMGAQILS